VPEKKKLTKRQAAVLRAIRQAIRVNGYPPTLRQIGDAVGHINVNAVRRHLWALEKKGAIRRDAGVARGIRVLQEA
jgi:repressor LexA